MHNTPRFKVERCITKIYFFTLLIVFCSVFVLGVYAIKLIDYVNIDIIK